MEIQHADNVFVSFLLSVQRGGDGVKSTHVLTPQTLQTTAV